MKKLLYILFTFGFLIGISLLQANAQKTYYGYEAGRDGNYNTHIGFRVATNTSYGFDNTFVGNESGRYNEGINSVFLGSYSGRNNDGSFNNFMGFESGKNNTGSYNIFLGAYSGNRTTGSYNTFMGHKSGHYNSSGEYNSFIGFQSGQNITTTVMDCREIDTLTSKYDGIMCGFCMPYLSKVDCAKLIKDCSFLLNNGGTIYLSTIEGDYYKSGQETGSNGQDKMYVYYHQEDYLQQALQVTNFELIELKRKTFPLKDGTISTHMIFIAKKK